MTLVAEGLNILQLNQPNAQCLFITHIYCISLTGVTCTSLTDNFYSQILLWSYHVCFL